MKLNTLAPGMMLLAACKCAMAAAPIHSARRHAATPTKHEAQQIALLEFRKVTKNKAAIISVCLLDETEWEAR
jgi:hypothetical protein